MELKSENGFVAVLDIHFGKKCGIRLDNIDEALVDKLKQIKDYCLENQVKVVLTAGDIFDGVKITWSSLTSIYKIFKEFYKEGIKVFVFWGNHDENRGNIKRRMETPLNFLVETELLCKYPDKLFSIANETSEPFHVRGFNYYDEIEPLPVGSRELNTVLVAHTFFQNEFMGGKHNIEEESLKELGYKHNILGHDHSAYPTWEKNSQSVYRFGSLGRVSSTKSELEREVGFMHFDYREAKFVPLEVRELKDIVVAKTLKADKKEETEVNYEELIKSISSKQELEEDTIMPVIQKINDKDIKKIIMKYI